MDAIVLAGTAVLYALLFFGFIALVYFISFGILHVLVTERKKTHPSEEWWLHMSLKGMLLDILVSIWGIWCWLLFLAAAVCTLGLLIGLLTEVRNWWHRGVKH